MADRTYIAIDLKSFYASCECVDLHLDPLTTNLVVKEEEVRPYLTDQRVAYELIAIANPLLHKERQGE